MKKVFIFRAIFYFVVLFIPLTHPSVPVYLDGPGIWLYWLLIPLGAIAAVSDCFSFSSDRKRFFPYLLLLALLMVTLIFVGWNHFLVDSFAAAIISFLLTRLIFKRKLYSLLYIEPFFYYLILFRMVSFTRILESDLSGGFPLSRILFLISCFLFLIQLFWVFRVSRFQAKKSDKRRGILWGVAFSLVFAVLAGIMLPENGFEYLQTLNNADKIKKNDPYPLDGNSRSTDDNGGTDRSQTGEGKNGENGKEYGSLMGVPADSWSQGMGNAKEGDQNGSGEAGGNQYLVMVVETPVEPVYLADNYYGPHDRQQGFIPDQDNPYNRLSQQRFLETWENQQLPEDRGRIPQWISIFSTISEKSQSWYPFMLEPTVYNSRYYPLIYTYRSFSFISSLTDKLPVPPLKQLSDSEREEMAQFLVLDLESDNRIALSDLLNQWINEDSSLNGKIEQILRGFESYQYQMGFTEDISSNAILNFLFESKTGDCTEFSHAAAMMGRLAGIPSRVVTGYLVSKGLQTPSHQLGIAKLRDTIPELAEGQQSDQYLVTTAHRHSWVQYYLSGYGWVDYESTRFAIPPPPGFDPNSQDVVIPVITAQENSHHEFVFPWKLLLLIIGGTAAGFVLILYLLRTTRILILIFRSRNADENGIKALYHLALVRVAARGWKIKNIDETAEEYADRYPVFKDFARLYTRTLYSGNAVSGYSELIVSYNSLMKETKNPKAVLKEIFSLKGWHLL